MMCAVTEVYCHIKNINAQYKLQCCKKVQVHVFIKTHLPDTGFFIVFFPTNFFYLLRVISDQIQKQKLKLQSRVNY